MPRGMVLSAVCLLAVGCGSTPETESDVDEPLGRVENALSWDPVCYLASKYDKAKYGDLHSHSDPPGPVTHGGGTPAQIFDAVKGVGDFNVVTEHGPLFSNAEYQNGCRDAANRLTSAAFLAACGWEVKIDATGPAGGGKPHANVLFAPEKAPFFGDPYASLNGFHTDVESCDGCVAQFNHPVNDAAQWHPGLYSPAANHKMELYEVNGQGTIEEKVNRYIAFLDQGWQISPVHNSDTHSVFQTDDSDYRTGAGVFVDEWADGKLASLRSAIRAHRTFANVHPNNAQWRAKISVVREDSTRCLMGSILNKDRFPQATLQIIAQGNVTGMRLFTNGTAYADSLKTTSCPGPNCDCSGRGDDRVCVWETNVGTAGRNWFAAWINRDSGWALTAPVWFK